MRSTLKKRMTSILKKKKNDVKQVFVTLCMYEGLGKPGNLLRLSGEGGKKISKYL